MIKPRDKYWKMDVLKEQIKSCSKCRLSETRIKALPGEGNLNAKIMLIAQAPGAEEDRSGKMFTGPSGKVLDELLKINRIKRDSLYMTNLVKCFLPKYRKPKQDEINACSPYLDEEIEIVNPEVLVTLGYYSYSYLMDKFHLPKPDKNALSSTNGRLILADSYKILALKHPVALLYSKDIKNEMIKSYSLIKVLETTCKWYPVCPVKYFTDRGLIDEKWVKLYCKGNWASCTRYQMEERGKYHPDWMLPDGSLNESLKYHY
ncbi:MAG: uracil-DNA glycosylase [Spirochaetales bacterium]|nr:uracil-DNA glycosylase [Spirochaetales bacterium]